MLTVPLLTGNKVAHLTGDSLVAGAGMPSGYMEAPGGLRDQMIAATPNVTPHISVSKAAGITVSFSAGSVSQSTSTVNKTTYVGNYTSHGIGGTKISDCRADMNSFIFNFSPTFLFLAFWANDFGSTDPTQHLIDYSWVLDQVHATLPNCSVLCIGGLTTTEQWLTGPNRLADGSSSNSIEQNIATACATRTGWTEYCRLSDAVLAYEMIHNSPSPGAASGILTLDGKHPNSTGQPFLATQIMTHLIMGSM